MRALLLVVLLLAFGAGPAMAQATADPPGTPGVITGGSSNTTIGGQPAARQGDTTTDAGGTVTGGSPNVFINGRPATTTGDKTGCGGVAVGGGSGVYVNGKPVARAGDITTGCPGK